MRRFPFLVLAAAALTAAAPAVAQPVRTLMVSAGDYPDDVRPGAAEFALTVRFELAPDGSVARCRVARSSRRPSIDAASCRILTERARFRPEAGAMRGRLRFIWLGAPSLAFGNARGAPIPFSLVDVMSGDDYPLPAIRNRENGTVEYDAAVSEAGLPQRCTVTLSSGSAALDSRTCYIVMSRGSFIPASDGAGRLRDGVYHGRMIWQFPGR